MTRRWSLSRRLVLWFAISTAGLVTAISLISVAFLSQAAERELDALVSEEIDEVRALCEDRPVTSDDFAGLALHVSDHHPEVGMAWRVFSGQGTEILAEYGTVSLLHETPNIDPLARETATPKPGLRWCVSSFHVSSWTSSADTLERGPIRVGLLIDGRQRRALLRQYGAVALFLIGFAALLAVAGGVFFARRVSATLRLVAEGARAAHESGDRLNPKGAPEEIREVAEAFDETLTRIRSEEERARLLIAGLAHELRSPLQNLLGETEVALLRERSPDEYRDVLESNAEELRDVARVVDNLVTLCAAQDGAKADVRERFDLGEELDLRLERERHVARRARQTVELQRRGDLSFAGDREALVLVVRNLVGNALHWAPEDSTVTVDVRGDADAVEITVDDAGPGVPDGERHKIFEPFYRGPAKKSGRVGYGLGLALSRTAVQSHGGTIAVETSPQGGARFHVRLPRG